MAPGPRVLWPAPDPAGSRPRSAPPPTAGARGPARRAHSLPTRNRNWPVGGTRAMASGRGQVGGGGTRPPPSAAGRRARSRVPGARGARGRRPALPSLSRTSRAAAEGALPAPARSRASSIARRPPLEESRRGDGKPLGAASRGFKDNNKKMATTQLPLRTPSESATAPGGGGVTAGGSPSGPRGARGAGRPPRPSGPRHNSARRGRRGESPRAPRARAPPPALTGCLVCGYILLRSRIIQTDLVGCAGQRRAAHWL